MVSLMMRRDKEATGAMVTFHFAGLDSEEAKALKAHLNTVAGQLGYTSHRGPLSGRGNAAALLTAIANGEVTVTRRERSDTMPRELAM